MLEAKKPAGHIRSFVKRGGRISDRQQQALDTLWPLYVYDLSAGDALTELELATAFVKPQPLVLEIGFGMGQSLAQMAQMQSDKNFLGVEVHRAGIGSLLADIADHQLENLKIVYGDAVTFLQQCVRDASLQRAQIFFPDPWPKQRHHKRRLIQADFVDLLAEKLVAGGELHLATDWQPYAEQMLDVLGANVKLSNSATDRKYIEHPEYRPLTKFEQRGQRLGHGIWDLLFVRI